MKSGSKRLRFRLPVKLISAIAIIFLAFAFIIGYSWEAVKNSDYFNVKEVIANENNAIDLSYFKGSNIFNLDLIKESRHILSSYPDYRAIKLVRVLPNRLFVSFIKRKPFALVKLYRYFAIDESGVFFYPSQEALASGLPVVTGLETKIFGPHPGKAYNIRELVLVLHILKEAKRNTVLKNCKINKIDVANIANASVFIAYRQITQDITKKQAPLGFGELEVKLGKDKIKDKIEILAGLLIDAKSSLSSIKYIDLRFKEPVMKFK